MTTDKNITDHVIFDLDGLLLNTEELYTQASTELLKEFGKPYSYELKARLMGKSPAEVAAAFVAHYGLDVTPEEWAERSRAKTREILPTCQFLPGALKLIHHFHKNGVPMAIATGSSPEQFRLKTANHDKVFSGTGAFAHVTGSADVKHTKPAPDVFIAARNKFGQDVDSSRCLVFEDAPNGVAAAKAAKMKCVMVPGAWMPKEMTIEADLVLKDLRDFKPEIFDLPAFNYGKVSHVIFDLDGTLADTGHFYQMASRSILLRHGVTEETLESEETQAFRATLTGRTSDQILPLVINYYKLQMSTKEFDDEFQENLLKLLPQCQLLPGVEKLVEHFKSKSVPMAIATSTTKSRFEATTYLHKDFFDQFDFAVTADDLEDGMAGKPAPDVFLLTAKRMGADPRDCLVFEDAKAGADAASSAGMQCVLIPAHNKLDIPTTKIATQLLDSMEEFRPQDFGLPAFEEGS